MNDTLKVVQVTGLSDTVLLAIIAGIVGLATLIINGRIEAKAKLAADIAALEALKISQKLGDVELKIDGRLTELLRISKLEAEERGHRLGKEQAKSEENVKVQESTSVQLPGATKLKIIEGEIKVTPSEVKKKT